MTQHPQPSRLKALFDENGDTGMVTAGVDDQIFRKQSDEVGQPALRLVDTTPEELTSPERTRIAAESVAAHMAIQKTFADDVTQSSKPNAS